MIDDKKVAFVICVNNELYFEECLWYINQLHIPDGYKKDVIRIAGAESMAQAYNAAMASSDARYKVYLHQDVFIYEREFIDNILKVFKEHEKLGMLGMVGGIDLPGNAAIWNAWNRGCVLTCNGISVVLLDYLQEINGIKGKKKGFTAAEAVDGMLIATQYDIPWREDLDLGWDFYDISQSLEFRRKGYEIGIPFQERPWCIHDCGHSKLEGYDLARKHMLNEYVDFFDDEYEPVIDEHNAIANIQENIFLKMKNCFEMNAFDQVLEIRNMLKGSVIRSNNLQYVVNLADICMLESCSPKEGRSFFYDTCSFEDMKNKYDTIKFIVRHIENGTDPERTRGLGLMIRNGELSRAAVLSIADHCAVNPDKIRLKILG
jgi:hypothetical protein